MPATAHIFAAKSADPLGAQQGNAPARTAPNPRQTASRGSTLRRAGMRGSRDPRITRPQPTGSITPTVRVPAKQQPCRLCVNVDERNGSSSFRGLPPPCVLWSTYGVNAFFASAIAVAGTLLGSTLTHLFQIRQSRRAETREIFQRLRQERLSAYTEFVAAATDYHRSAFTHWYRKQEGQERQGLLDARAEADRLQAVVDRAITQIRLLSDDNYLIAAAQQVRSSAEEIRKAESRRDRDAQGDNYQAALDQFINHASDQLTLQSGFDPNT